MKVIYKYPLKLTALQEIEIAKAFSPRSVLMQREQLVLYAEVDTAYGVRARKVWILGTGYELPTEAIGANFVGTVQDHEFVWHVYIQKQTD